MILAEKIMSLRKRNGWSQEELAEQLDVSRQSVSKWESGNSIPDIEKIIKMSQLFSVSTDYLLKDDADDEQINSESTNYQAQTTVDSDSQARPISMEFASEYMDLVKNMSKKFAFGVSLCVISPVILIALSGMSEVQKYHITEAFAAGVGVPALLIIVAAAVAIFITQGTKLSKYEFLEKETISLMYGVESVVNRRKEAFDPTFRMSIAIGVMICIISSIPLITVAAAGVSEFSVILCVCLLLVLVSIAVFLFVSAGMIHESFAKLLQEEDYTVENKTFSKKYSGVIGAYWCTIVAIFLGYSFYVNDWSRSWIIWPVAGVLFVPFKMIIEAIGKKSE